jgi:acyl-CoA reductase-like NAD-dependent aldehyde dehydrogenase
MIKGQSYIAGKWKDGNAHIQVINPFTNDVIGTVPKAENGDIETAISAAKSAFGVSRSLTAYERSLILERASKRIEAQEDELAKLIALEAGKPMRYARGEAKRACETFKFASLEAREIYGEVIPMDAASRGKDYFGFSQRIPRGVIAAITPFNFPLNLVAHKIAPALASGNSIILKPASVTPLSSFKLGKILEESGLPPGILNIIYGSGSDVGMRLVRDDRVQMVTFTGSLPVGETIRGEAGFKTVTLELGNNAAVVVEDIDNLEDVVDRLMIGAFAYSGQVCISVQRIYVNRTLFDGFLRLFVEKTGTQIMGDPLDERTDIGPMITPSEAFRVKEWLNEATSSGAEVATGGTVEGNFVHPTVLTNVTNEMKVMRDEVFAPVVSLVPYDDYAQGLAMANDTRYGLQAAVYTKDVNKIMKAVDAIDAGGLIINDFPTFRVDHMPYGGVKKSGTGREGLKYAIEEMTEIKLVVIKRQS